jgi:predicted nuclease with TOPRIM domain
MTNKTSASSDSSPSPDSGAIDSLWQPSWWRWLISALSGTVETKKQIAWLRKSTEELKKYNEELKKYNEELKKYNEELRKSNEDARMQHEQRLSELKKENARLAELELRLDAVLPKSVSN